MAHFLKTVGKIKPLFNNVFSRWTPFAPRRKKFPPKEVENITGVSEAEVYQAAKLMADNRPGTVIWCMGGTQHHVGNANTRAYCILQLALGNMGVSGGGTNIFRGHDNVQGATDLGLLFDNLPGYYGLTTGAWTHWTHVWDLDMEWMKGRFDQGTYRWPRTYDYAGYPLFSLARWCTRRKRQTRAAR